MTSPRWYSYLVRSIKSGDQSVLEDEKVEFGNLLICHETPYHRFAKFSSHRQLFLYQKETPKIDRCYYELILGDRCQKIYFDIDIKVSEIMRTEEDSLKVLRNLIDVLISEYPCIKSSNLVVATSHGKSKYSYHVIVTGWYVQTNSQSEAVYMRVKNFMESPYRCYIDMLYGRKQQFRLLNSTKIGQNRYKTHRPDLTQWSHIGNDADFEIFKAFLVSNVENCKQLPMKMIIDEPHEQNNLSLSTSEIKEILSHFKTSYRDSSSFRLSRVEGSMIMLTRIRPSTCLICQRIHDSDNPFLYVVGLNRAVFFDCRRRLEAFKPFSLGYMGASLEAWRRESRESSSDQVKEEPKVSINSPMKLCPAPLRLRKTSESSKESSLIKEMQSVSLSIKRSKATPSQDEILEFIRRKSLS